MELLNSITKLFIDFFSYIPGLILQVFLFILSIYFFSNELALTYYYHISSNILSFSIILLGLMYPINIFVNGITKCFKINLKDYCLNKTDYDNIINEYKLTRIPNDDNCYEKGLIDVSDFIGYNIPIFFDNKIILLKSIRNTLIFYSFIFFFLYIYNFFYVNVTNIFIITLMLFIFIILIFFLRDEIIEYKKGLRSSLLNIGFFIQNFEKTIK